MHCGSILLEHGINIFVVENKITIAAVQTYTVWKC